MADLVTLGLRIDATGAIRDLEQVERGLNKVAAASKGTEKGFRDSSQATAAYNALLERQAAALRAAGGGNDALKDTIRRVQQDVIRADRAMQHGAITTEQYARAIRLARSEATQLGVAVGSSLDKAIYRSEAAIYRSEAALAKVGTASRSTAVGIFGLRGAATALVTSVLGTNAALGSTIGVLGTLAIGSSIMAGALLGVAALAKGWELITRRSKEAKVAMNEAIDAAKALMRQDQLGVAGELGVQAKLLRADQGANSLEIARLERITKDFNPDAGDEGQLGSATLARALSDLNTLREINRQRGEEARRLENEVLQIEREARSAADAIVRSGNAARAATDKQLADERIAQAEREAREQERILKESLARRLSMLTNAPGAEAIGYSGPGLQQNAIRASGGLNLNPVTISRGTPTPFAIAGGIDLSFLSALKAQITGLAASFGPLAIAAAVLAPVMEGLAPVFEILKEPLRVLGQLIGLIITPTLRLLEVPLKLAVTAVSYFTEALGHAQMAFGKLIDTLPWISGSKIIKAGQEMVDGARAARAGLTAAGDAADRFAKSMANIPDLTTLALFRYRSSGGPITEPTGGAMPPGALGGTNWRNQPNTGTRDRTGGQGTYVDLRGATIVGQFKNADEFLKEMDSANLRSKSTGGRSFAYAS